MNTRKNHELSAPSNADFIRELDRYSVPFGVQLDGEYAVVPPTAWARVFCGPVTADGLPVNAGGVPANIVKAMRNTRKRAKAQAVVLHPQTHLDF